MAKYMQVTTIEEPPVLSVRRAGPAPTLDCPYSRAGGKPFLGILFLRDMDITVLDSSWEFFLGIYLLRDLYITRNSNDARPLLIDTQYLFDANPELKVGQICRKGGLHICPN